MGYSIFVQYFGVIDAFIRHIIMNFSPQNAKSRALTHVYANFILFKLTNVEIYQTKYIVYAFTEIWSLVNKLYEKKLIFDHLCKF